MEPEDGSRRNSLETFTSLPESAYTISSVHQWSKAFKTRRTSVLDELRVRRPRIDHIDSKILSLFTKNEFHSVRTLAQELAVSLSTVYDRLITVLGFSLWHTPLVLHLLIEELKAQRITTSSK
jgi:hypothetical protein